MASPNRKETIRRICLCLASYHLAGLCAVSQLVPPQPAHAVCGEALAETRQAIVAEEAAFRTTQQIVRAARAEMLSRESTLRDTLANPPTDYAQGLARQLSQLRRTEVQPKLQTLEHLRSQHEEARQHWERGHQLLHAQMSEARVAVQTNTLSADDFCGVQERYVQALQLYQQGMQRYRAGMELYAEALQAYSEHFLLPYIRGFADQQQWELLIQGLEQGDFLHNFLVPLTANAVRTRPPDIPP